jgi:hypothetical protein
MSTRQADGTFALGNPGRPRRAIERDFLSALAQAVPLAEWQAIVAKAVTDAKAGNAKAREWLSKHLLGDDPLAVVELADELARLKSELGVRDENDGVPARISQSAANGTGGAASAGPAGPR